MDNPKVVRISSDQELDTLNVAKTAIYDAARRMEEALREKDFSTAREIQEEIIGLFRSYGRSRII